jgi:hypothetical protein
MEACLALVIPPEIALVAQALMPVSVNICKRAPWGILPNPIDQGPQEKLN